MPIVSLIIHTFYSHNHAELENKITDQTVVLDVTELICHLALNLESKYFKKTHTRFVSVIPQLPVHHSWERELH